MAFVDSLARFRALATAGHPLPPDLGEWAIEQLERLASIDYARLNRDRHLHAAGVLIGGPINKRAREILLLDDSLCRAWARHQLETPDLTTARGRVHAARLIRPVPRNRRLRIILAETDGQG